MESSDKAMLIISGTFCTVVLTAVGVLTSWWAPLGIITVVVLVVIFMGIARWAHSALTKLFDKLEGKENDAD